MARPHGLFMPQPHRGGLGVREERLGHRVEFVCRCTLRAIVFILSRFDSARSMPVHCSGRLYSNVAEYLRRSTGPGDEVFDELAQVAYHEGGLWQTVNGQR